MRSRALSVLAFFISCSAFSILRIVHDVSALGLAVPAGTNGVSNTRCVKQYLYSNMVVTGKATVEGNSEMQTLSMDVWLTLLPNSFRPHTKSIFHIKIVESNVNSVVYRNPLVKGEAKFAFRTHHDGYVTYCLHNKITGGKTAEIWVLQLTLDISSFFFRIKTSQSCSRRGY